mgnify:CR=1 FL=1
MGLSAPMKLIVMIMMDQLLIPAFKAFFFLVLYMRCHLKRIHIETHGFLSFHRIVWTNSMKRLFSLVEHCYKHKEPMLLIGETGCGKTTVCQLLAMIHGQSLHILNCHQHTETADFLGVCVTMFSSITVLCDILA